MIKYQILHIVSFLVILVSSIESASSCNCSTFERSYKNVLSRKKRFLIFPKGAAIINSSGFGKQIVTGFPRGFNWILELDMFYALPYEARLFSQAKDLLFGKNNPKPSIPTWLQPQYNPKEPSYSTYKPVLRERLTTPIMPQSVQMMSSNYHPEHYSSWDSHEGEIFVPSSGWKDDVLTNIQAQVNAKHRSWDPYNTTGYDSNSYWLNNNRVEDRKYFDNPRGRSMKHEDSRWNNIYAQKDRKELYDIIHAGLKKIGIDATACLQRTICEVRHFLLPKGESLLHDVFRVIFTYPMHTDDKWAEAARVDDETACSEVFECPMSFLDFFLHSGHIF